MFDWLFKRKRKRRLGDSISPHQGLLYTPLIADGGAGPANAGTPDHHHPSAPDCDPGTPADSGPTDCSGSSHSCGGHSCGGASCGGGGASCGGSSGS